MLQQLAVRLSLGTYVADWLPACIGCTVTDLSSASDWKANRWRSIFCSCSRMVVSNDINREVLTAKRDSCPRAELLGIFIPEGSRTERAVALTVFVAACAYLFVFRRYTAMEPDEGIVLQGAQRILGGEVLYRDFFSFFTPGSYYFLALIFKIFGSSIIVARTALVIFGAAFSAITYVLCRRVCTRGSALRSEEHTSELQSHHDLVCRLLLEK